MSEGCWFFTLGMRKSASRNRDSTESDLPQEVGLCFKFHEDPCTNEEIWKMQGFYPVLVPGGKFSSTKKKKAQKMGLYAKISVQYVKI